MTHVNAIAVGVGEDEGVLLVVLVRQAFDDADVCSHAGGVDGLYVIHEEMCHVHGAGRVITLQAEVQLGVVFLQDHEADGIAVLKDFLEAEHAGVEGECGLNIAHSDGWGHAAKTYCGDGCVCHA